MKTIRVIFLSILIFTCGSVSAMPILSVDLTGQLRGASGVNVGGILYDVEFTDGTCIALFDGCDDASDFAFSTESAARSAAQALLHQVFLDTPSGQFDSTPELTKGCEAFDKCLALIPYRIQPTHIDVTGARNTSPPLSDSTTVGTTHSDSDQTLSPRFTWARFTQSSTQLPEPSTITLLSLAFTVMGWQIRRSA